MTSERLASLKAINAKARADWPFPHGPWMLDAVDELIAEIERLQTATLTAIEQDAVKRLPEGYSIAIDLFHTHSDVGLYNPEGDEVGVGYDREVDDITAMVLKALAKADELAASVRKLVADANGGAR